MNLKYTVCMFCKTEIVWSVWREFDVVGRYSCRLRFAGWKQWLRRLNWISPPRHWPLRRSRHIWISWTVLWDQPQLTLHRRSWRYVMCWFFYTKILKRWCLIGDVRFDGCKCPSNNFPSQHHLNCQKGPAVSGMAAKGQEWEFWFAVPLSPARKGLGESSKLPQYSPGKAPINLSFRCILQMLFGSWYFR